MVLIAVVCHKIDATRFANIRASVEGLAEKVAHAGITIEVTHHCVGEQECSEGTEHSSPRILIRMTTGAKETLADLALSLDTYLLLSSLFASLGIECRPGTISVVCLLDGPQYCPDCHAQLSESGTTLVCTDCGFSKPA